MGVRSFRESRRGERLLWKTLGWVVRREALFQIVQWAEPERDPARLHYEFAWARTRALERKYRAAVLRYERDFSTPEGQRWWSEWRAHEWARPRYGRR